MLEEQHQSSCCSVVHKQHSHKGDRTAEMLLLLPRLSVSLDGEDTAAELAASWASAFHDLLYM